jgi:hypothetical protein
MQMENFKSGQQQSSEYGVGIQAALRLVGGASRREAPPLTLYLKRLGPGRNSLGLKGHS